MEAKIELYRSVIESYPGSVLVTDRTGTIILANRMAMELTGRTREEIVGWSAYEMVRQNVFSRSTLTESLETGEVTMRYLTIKGDQSLGVLAIGIPIFDDRGELTHVVAFSQSEAFAREYYAKLELEKQQMRRMFQLLLNAGPKREVISKNPKMKDLFDFAVTISDITATILIYGESGTGKEVLAKEIYQCSALSKQIFVPINCAAIPAELMESEFFGYERGAFTGASREGKPGLFELANHGTLFLDEVGELTLNMQSKLLRVLESGEFRRLGGSTVQKSTVRIIAATNRDLEEMVRNGSYREDLFYRLNVIPLRIPPLRERPEDLVPLIELFAAKYNRKYKLHTELTQEAIQKLLAYHWPGNVRELKNVVERLVITGGRSIEGDPLLGAARRGAASPPAEYPAYAGGGGTDSYKTFMESAERAFLTQKLEECRGNVAELSRKIGLHSSGVYRKLEKYQLEPKKYMEKKGTDLTPEAG